MKRSWIITTAAVCILVLTLGVVAWAGNDPPPVATTASVQMQGTERATLEVRGMACSSCAATVQAMLERTPGVARAHVTVDRAEAIVEYDPQRVTTADLVRVVDRLGYGARIKESGRREG